MFSTMVCRTIYLCRGSCSRRRSIQGNASAVGRSPTAYFYRSASSHRFPDRTPRPARSTDGRQGAHGRATAPPALPGTPCTPLRTSAPLDRSPHPPAESRRCSAPRRPRPPASSSARPRGRGCGCPAEAAARSAPARLRTQVEDGDEAARAKGRALDLQRRRRQPRLGAPLPYRVSHRPVPYRI